MLMRKFGALSRRVDLGYFFLPLVLGSCGSPNSEVRDDCICGFYTNGKTGRMLTWPDGSNIQFRYSNTVSQTLRGAIKSSTEQYNQRLQNTQITFDESNAAPDFNSTDVNTTSRDNINGIYEVSHPWPFPNESSADAVTVLKFNEDRIEAADIYLKQGSFNNNGNYPFGYPGYYPGSGLNPNGVPNGTFSAVFPRLLKFFTRALASSTEGNSLGSSVGNGNERSVYLIALHEFGHVLGMIHNQSSGSIMNQVVDQVHLTQPFTYVDLETLRRAYPLKPGF